MPSALSPNQVIELYGSLRWVLHQCPAGQIRGIVGAAGWDLARIPDGLDETGTGVRRPIIESAIDGLWAEFSEETRQARLRNLAQALIDFYKPKNMTDKVQSAILKNGFSFLNGDFVPVDATGQVPR